MRPGAKGGWGDCPILQVLNFNLLLILLFYPCPLVVPSSTSSPYLLLLPSQSTPALQWPISFLKFFSNPSMSQGRNSTYSNFIYYLFNNHVPRLSLTFFNIFNFLYFARITFISFFFLLTSPISFSPPTTSFPNSLKKFPLLPII